MSTDSTWRQGVPDDLRLTFLQAKRYGVNLRAALIMLEIANEWQREGGAHFTEKQLLDFAQQDLRYSLTRATTRQGIQQLVAIGILLESGDSYKRDIEVSKTQQNSSRGILSESGDSYKRDIRVSKTQQNSSRGRTARNFTLCSRFKQVAALRTFLSIRLREAIFAPVESAAIPDEPDPLWFEGDPLADDKATAIRLIDEHRLSSEQRAAQIKARTKHEAALERLERQLTGLEYRKSTVLPAAAYANTRAYVDAIRLAIVQASEGRQLSTRAAAVEVGVSPSTIQAIDSRVGIARIAEYEIVPLAGSGKVSERIAAQAPKLKDDPRVSVVAAPDDSSALESAAPHKHLASIKPHSLNQWAFYREVEGLNLFLRVQRPSREVLTEKRAARPRQAALPRKPSGKPKQSDKQLTLWRFFSPRYVDVQLTLRGLQNEVDNLLNIAAHLEHNNISQKEKYIATDITVTSHAVTHP